MNKEESGRYLVMFTNPEMNSFLCFAENVEHAKEQAENAYPDDEVYSIFHLELIWHKNGMGN